MSGLSTWDNSIKPTMADGILRFFGAEIATTVTVPDSHGHHQLLCTEYTTVLH